MKVLSLFFHFLSRIQSNVISESEDGRGGTECMRRKEKVRNSALGKWEKEGTKENSMIIWQHERANLNPMVMSFKRQQSCTFFTSHVLLWRAGFKQGLMKGK